MTTNAFISPVVYFLWLLLCFSCKDLASKTMDSKPIADKESDSENMYAEIISSSASEDKSLAAYEIISTMNHFPISFSFLDGAAELARGKEIALLIANSFKATTQIHEEQYQSLTWIDLNGVKNKFTIHTDEVENVLKTKYQLFFKSSEEQLLLPSYLSEIRQELTSQLGHPMQLEDAIHRILYWVNKEKNIVQLIASNQTIKLEVSSFKWSKK